MVEHHTYPIPQMQEDHSPPPKKYSENALAITDKNPLKIHDFYDAEENIPLIN